MKTKFIFLAAAAACLVCTGVCFGAYYINPSAVIANVSGEGVNDAADYLAMDITPPSGNEQAISPLVISLTIDCDALRKSGTDGSAQLRIDVSYAEGVTSQGEEGKNIFESAVCSCTFCDAPAAADKIVSGSGRDACLSVCMPFEVPSSPLARANVSISFSPNEQTAEFFRANSSRLFTVRAYVVQA